MVSRRAGDRLGARHPGLAVQRLELESVPVDGEADVADVGSAVVQYRGLAVQAGAQDLDGEIGGDYGRVPGRAR